MTELSGHFIPDDPDYTINSQHLEQTNCKACFCCTYFEPLNPTHQKKCLLQGRIVSEVACCDAWTGRTLDQIDQDMVCGLWHDWEERTPWDQKKSGGSRPSSGA